MATNEIRPANHISVILCVVMAGFAHLTIHNIHYAPFVCRRPAAQSAVFIRSYFYRKNILLYHKPYTQCVLKFLPRKNRKNSSYTHPKCRILSSKSHPTVKHHPPQPQFLIQNGIKQVIFGSFRLVRPRPITKFIYKFINSI